MHLLDTDTLTYYFQEHPLVGERVRALPESEVGTTIINRGEILRGRFDFLLKAANGEDWLRAHAQLVRDEGLLARLLIVGVDDVAAVVFDRLREVKSLKKIGRADLLIASIALAHNATLVTRNLRHFQRIPGLHPANWVD